MNVNATSGFVVIGQDPKTKDFYFQEREDNNGNPGKINGAMGDGSGDVRGVVNSYVAKGYDPEHILYNGQPVTKVFTKVVDDKGNVSFKGIYKVTLPRVDKAKDENEKNALTEASINSTLMGFNYSIDYPRINKDQAAVYYKIDDKNDKNFEAGFKNIIDNCNKTFNVDIAQKKYIQKVDESEFKKATPVNELEN